MRGGKLAGKKKKRYEGGTSSIKSTLLSLHFPEIHGRVCVCVCVCEEIGIKKYLLFFNFASRFCNVRCNISFSTSIRVCSTKYFTSRFVYLFILFILYSLTLFNRKSTRIDKVFSIVLFSNYNFIWK